MRRLLSTISVLALTVTASFAADLPRQMPAKAPAYVPVAYNWTGFYLGLNGGGVHNLTALMMPAAYKVQNYSVEVVGVFTNTTPTDAYRGAGRPEATFVLERLVDLFAQRIGMDPAEVRRRNLVPKFLEARPAISGLSVDSGDYATTLQMALDQVKYDERRK